MTAGVAASIVVVAADRAVEPGALASCLAAVRSATDPAGYELIVVDPGDEDSTRLHEASLTVAYSGGGPLMAANQGAELARGRLIVLLDPRATVRPGWLDALTAAFDDPDVAVAGPALLRPDGAVAAAGWLVADDGSVRPFPSGVATSCDVDAVSRHCMAVRGAAWRALGGFDARYAPGGYEDIDLCFSARGTGWAVRCEPAAEVVIPGAAAEGASAAGRRRFVTRWGDVLRRQEPPALQGAVADRAARSVTLAAGGAARLGPGSVAVLAPGRDARADAVGEALAAAGRPVRWAAGGSPALVWMVGPAAIEERLVPVRRACPDAVLVVDLPAPVLASEVAPPDADRAEAVERWCLRLADVVVTTSERAAAALLRHSPGAEVAVVPHVAPIRPAASGGREGVAMVVAPGRPEDLEAARWLTREVAPRTKVGLWLVGDTREAALRALVGPDVHLVGLDRVDDVLRRAAVAAAPWRSGAGMHDWAVRALAAGIPLVATPLGVEGLGVEAGRHAVVSPTADGLARGIIDFASDPAEWVRCSTAGQDLVREHRLTPAGLAERLCALCGRLAGAIQA